MFLSERGNKNAREKLWVENILKSGEVVMSHRFCVIFSGNFIKLFEEAQRMVGINRGELKKYPNKCGQGNILVFPCSTGIDPPGILAILGEKYGAEINPAPIGRRARVHQ